MQQGARNPLSLYEVKGGRPSTKGEFYCQFALQNSRIAGMRKAKNSHDRLLYPTVDDIRAIIAKLHELKRQKEELKGRDFLTPTQRKTRNFRTDVDAGLYLARMATLEPKRYDKNFVYPIQRYFAPTGSTERGRFIWMEDGVKWYGHAKQDPLRVRCEFDRQKLVDVLKGHAKKSKQSYWDKYVNPLISQLLDKLLFPYWSHFKAHGSWEDNESKRIETAIRSKRPADLDEVITEMERFKHLAKQTNRRTKTKKKKVKTKEPEKRFKPLADAGDIRFVIDGQRVMFYDGRNDPRDLRLKNDSQTQNLLIHLTSGSMQPNEVKQAISPDTQNTAAKIVDYANTILNKKIRKVGFTCLPDYDVEFIERDKFGSYVKTLPIVSKEDFESWRREQPWK